jgi:hypothetical protein
MPAGLDWSVALSQRNLSRTHAFYQVSPVNTEESGQGDHILRRRRFIRQQRGAQDQWIEFIQSVFP